MSNAPVDTLIELKSWPWFFADIITGQRTADIRCAKDRTFERGQLLRLMEFDPTNGTYTGRECEVEVTHITSRDTPCALSSAVLHPDYCVLSIRLCSVGTYQGISR